MAPSPNDTDIESGTRQPTHSRWWGGSGSGRGNPSGYGALDAADATAALGAQRAAFQRQDEDLDAMTEGVGSIKNVAHLISNEVVQQNKMLDGLTDSLERANWRTERARDRAATTERSPYTIQNFCMLLWPTVLLILLIIEAVKHFLFD